ncbi:hypothetical protein [Amycolatopsis minnesotensis]|uniref:Sigma-70-like protein n=1 Tax=Amycolatopsis minnesotensis TaxID=337894 RepID=A0ABN2QMF8_9PSEU
MDTVRTDGSGCCARCGSPLGRVRSGRVGRPAKYCSSACRQAAHRERQRCDVVRSEADVRDFRLALSELAERVRGSAAVEKGPYGFTPTATELVDLAFQVQAVAIACDRATGLSWAAIAARTGLSRDRVRRECQAGAEVAARLVGARLVGAAG